MSHTSGVGKLDGLEVDEDGRFVLYAVRCVAYNRTYHQDAMTLC